MSGHIDDLYEGLPSSVLGVPVYPAHKWYVPQGWVAVNARRGTGIVVAAMWGAQTLRTYGPLTSKEVTNLGARLTMLQAALYLRNWRATEALRGGYSNGHLT